MMQYIIKWLIKADTNTMYAKMATIFYFIWDSCVPICIELPHPDKMAHCASATLTPEIIVFYLDLLENISILAECQSQIAFV